MKDKLIAGLVALGTAFSMTEAAAGVLRISESNFVAGAGLITFDEFALNTPNPTYTPTDYGGGAGSPTVSFDGFFAGQSISGNAAIDCPGAAATACVIGTPNGPLALDPASPDTFITSDIDAPNSPVLTGAPRFNGPIAILFDIDLAGVGFDAGFFDSQASTAITAFARDGSLLGSVSNVGLGIEFLGLVTDNGAEQIAGVFLDLIGSEPAGFAVDSLRFGRAGQVVIPTPSIPEPATFAVFAAGLIGLAFARRRKTFA